MIKLVITDVDGTLVAESKGEINPEYYDVIRKLSAQGIKVCVASGRPFSSLYSLFKPVADLIWFVSDGGATMKIGDHFETIGAIPRDWVNEIWTDISKIPQTEAMYCCKEIVYAPLKDSEMYNLSHFEYKMDIKALGGWEVDKLPCEETPKISLFSYNDIEKKASEHFIPKWKDRLHIVSAGDWWIDCMMPNINKGTALKYLLDNYGYKAEEVMASGDNMNDLEMIKMAGTSLAVSTARDEVKQAATKIIDNFTKDGVLNEWKKLLI